MFGKHVERLFWAFLALGAIAFVWMFPVWFAACAFSVVPVGMCS